MPQVNELSWISNILSLFPHFLMFSLILFYSLFSLASCHKSHLSLSGHSFKFLI